MRKLEGKVALITGGSSGIGRATALLFAKEGAKVVVAARQESGNLEETVTMIKASGGETSFVKTDVTNSKDVQNMVKTTVDTYGRLDILFNNAGIHQSPNLITDIPEEDWSRVIEINLKGVFLGMKYAIPEMIKGGGGVIINTSSAGAFIPLIGMAVYDVSKAGVLSLTRTAAQEYANQNIRVNCICPGAIQTPMLDHFRSGPVWERIKGTRRPNPMGRLGTPEEVAPVVLLLACDDSSYMTGAAINMDGGSTPH